MTFEEIKQALLTSHDEGVDTASVLDSVLSEISNVMYELEDNRHKVEDLTQRVATLTDTNYKLLDKVRYINQEEEEKGEPDEPEITLDNLFEEE